ncbi:hypothetical protein L249_3166 [Ophiocordyceps polyrhachis-furcata BCC 54312]|uniref:Uncharacterized protein n=1 Tax=Ophiocordyceps polyrhachis-furcata BCC 54312 TaxID=1330021 RepID=A0A367LPG0_9HYPO|nr:hypothetical protein L249_3166 [Ophiocordyceps polyrhachis-furcata BCC 54312]
MAHGFLTLRIREHGPTAIAKKERRHLSGGIFTFLSLLRLLMFLILLVRFAMGLVSNCLFIMLFLQWLVVASHPGIECGRFQQHAFQTVLDSIDVSDDARFKAQYINPIYLHTLFSVLPVELLIAINTNWHLNTYRLAELLSEEQQYSPDTRTLRESIDFYREASINEIKVCWLSNLTIQHQYHKNVLGAVNNLLISYESAEWDMPRRPRYLPPGELRQDRPICLSADDVQARWFEKHLPALRRDKFQEDDTSPYFDLMKMKIETYTWAGTFGRIVQEAICKSQSGRALEHVVPGVPIPAGTYGSFFDKMSRFFRSRSGVCFTLGKMKSGSIPMRFYWIDAGRNRP